MKVGKNARQILIVLPAVMRKFRRSKGLTQAELARLLDVSRQELSYWEQGAYLPSKEKFIDWCNIILMLYPDDLE